MPKRIICAGIMTALVMVVHPAGVRSARAQGIDQRVDSSSSSIGFEARSTLHPITGTAESFEGEFQIQSVEGTLTAQGDIRVRIESLRSGNKALDRNMYRMFDSAAYPEARCRISSLEARLPLKEETAPARLKAELTIRTVTLPFEEDVELSRENNAWIISGSTVVSLKAFELKPPTILGVIRMQDEVKVTFRVAARAAADDEVSRESAP